MKQQTTSVPNHVAIIMDGNGRWAQAQEKNRSAGHFEGARRVRAIIDGCDKEGVKILTLFCFSTENWNRPQEEVSVLMEILVEFMKKEGQELIDNNIRINVFGDLSKLPESVAFELSDLENRAKGNTGFILNFCISYGGRLDITRAAKTIAEKVLNGENQLDEIDESFFSKHLYTGKLPDPDLIIRTSGEYRISNFLLWQCAYSEIYFTDVLWPEFDPEELKKALLEYSNRARRYGKSDEFQAFGDL